MCCVVAALFALGPRAAILFWWLIEPVRWGAAFETFIWPFLGFIFLPWTTLMYIIAWSPVVGINGFWDVLLIVIGVLLDIASYAAKPAYDRRRAY